MPDQPEIRPDVQTHNEHGLPDSIDLDAILSEPIDEIDEDEELEEPLISELLHEPRPETEPPVTGANLPM